MDEQRRAALRREGIDPFWQAVRETSRPDPRRCERAETTRDCPLNHDWYGKEARHR